MPDFGWDNILGEKRILRNVSDLVVKGELNKAIALLEEALITRSSSVKLLDVLSDLYFRSDQPQKAYKCKEELLKNVEPTSSNIDSDLPDESDFAFLEEQFNQLDETEYHFEQPKVEQELSTKPKLQLKNSDQIETKRPTNKINIPYNQCDRDADISVPNNTVPESNQIAAPPLKVKTPKLDNHERKILTLKMQRHSEMDMDDHSVNVIYKPRLETREQKNNVDESITKIFETSVDVEQKTQAVLDGNSDDKSLDKTSITGEDINNVTFTIPSKDENFEVDETSWSEDEFDFLNGYVDEQDANDEVITTFGLHRTDDLEDSFSFQSELYDIWDDESDEYSEDEIHDSSILDDRLTREERARLVAVECIIEFNWHTNKLSFLTDVFSTQGWGSIRKSLEREVHAGTTAEELELAFAVKKIWQDSSRYWINFSKAWALGESADATYRHCSWKQALRLVRLFDNLPSIDEIYNFLESEFDVWYHHSVLRLCFPAFNKYLFLYRLNNRNETTLFNGFELPVEHDGLEALWLSQLYGNPMLKLNALGFDLVTKFTTKSYYASDIHTYENMLELFNSSQKSGTGDAD